MQLTHNHPTYGLITYTESAWTGKKFLYIDGVELARKNKKTFILPANQELPERTVTLAGSYVGGLTMQVEGDPEVITLTPKTHWYDYFLGIMPAVLFFAFVIGGAIGGAIAGMMAVGLIIFMKSRTSIPLKLLVSLGLSAIFTGIGIYFIMQMLSQA